jgi:hypothetical protein
MSIVRHTVRMTLITGTVLLATTVIATPALAADADCALNRLPSRMSAGGESTTLTGVVRNTSRDTLIGVQLTYVVRLDGLQADQVSLGSLALSGGDGEVRGTEIVAFLAPRRSRHVAYELAFGAGAPSGKARVTLEVAIRENQEWHRVDSATVSTTVRSAALASTPPATPTTAAEVAPTGGSPTGAAAPQAKQIASDSGLSHWPLYLIGFLLLAGGGGAAALLLLRRPADDPERTEYAAAYGQPGYAVPGQVPPGYRQPGNLAPGYAAPGQVPPGYRQPGYVRPGHAQPGPGHTIPFPAAPPSGDAPTEVLPAIPDVTTREVTPRPPKVPPPPSDWHREP